jgi:hypothetical protein
MGDKHEEFLAAILEGSQSRGSGNQWHNQMDGRHNRMNTEFAFAWDGKSTLHQSIGVSRAMWAKAKEQAAGERPMLGLRFYDNERLDVGLDLIVVSAYDMSEVLARLREEEAR